MAAAPVGDAEGGGARGEHGGPGGPARAGALLGRLGPHAADRRAGQDSPGPVLQDAGGIERGWAGKSRRRGVWVLNPLGLPGDLSLEDMGGLESSSRFGPVLL